MINQVIQARPLSKRYKYIHFIYILYNLTHMQAGCFMFVHAQTCGYMQSH